MDNQRPVSLTLGMFTDSLNRNAAHASEISDNELAERALPNKQ